MLMQYSFCRLGQETVSLRIQLMAIKTTQAGECAWEPANATALPCRGAGGLLYAEPTQVSAALTSAEARKPQAGLAQNVDIAVRTLVAMLMLGELGLEGVVCKGSHQEGETTCCTGTRTLCRQQHNREMAAFP